MNSIRRNSKQISPSDDESEKELQCELKEPPPSDEEHEKCPVDMFHNSFPPPILRRTTSIADEECEFHNSFPPPILRRTTSIVDYEDDSTFKPLRRTSSMPVTQTQLDTPRTASKVSFQSVQIREYKIALVENPGCTRGPPIGLGESYTVKDDIDLLTYEIERGPRRNRSKLHMNKWKRKNMLKLTTDHTEEEIKQVTKDVQRTRAGRSFSSALWPFLDAKEALGSAGKRAIRKMKKNKEVDPGLTRSAHF